MPKFWSMKAAASEPAVAEINIMGDIVFSQWDKWSADDVAASEFKDELDALGDVSLIRLNVNSYGGDVFAGQAIHSMLVSHPARVEATVLGIAASIASVIVAAADEVTMPANAMMMVHNPWTFAIGNSEYMRKLADDLDTIRESIVTAYMRKVGDTITRDEMIALMDGETYLSAAEALDNGLADVVTEALPIAAYASNVLAALPNVPDALKAALAKGVEEPDPDRHAELVTSAQASSDAVRKTLAGL